MVSYTYQMPSGIPGAITRPEVATIEALMLDQSVTPDQFGIPVKITSGVVRPIVANDVASSVIGVLVRPYPTSGNGTDGLGVAVPNKNFPADVLKRGFISVIVNNYAVSPPTKNSPVYVRVGNAGANKVIGRFEAAAEVTAAGAAAGGNTGNGAISAVSAGANAQKGVYVARVVIAGTNTATINLYDPNGQIVDSKQITGSGLTAVFANDQIAATITDGSTDFVVGDSFNITVTANTILLTNAVFTGGVDSAGNGEIAYNI